MNAFEQFRAFIRPTLARWRRARRQRRLPRFVQLGYFCDIHPSVEFIGTASIVIGDWVRIRAHGELMGPIVIGARTRMNRHVYLRPNTTIGRDVMIAAFVRILTDHHPIRTVRHRVGPVTYEPVVIEDGAWIGAGSIILPGRRIGRGAIVGAGSVVTHDVPPDTVWAGNPARMLRKLEPLRAVPEELFGMDARARFRPPPGFE